MKIKLTFTTIVEVDKLTDELDKEQDLYFGFVVGADSLIKELVNHTSKFRYEGYSVGPEVDEQLRKLKNLIK